MEKLNLQKAALAAEIIGGFAIVVTLIFLVLETRANTRAIQAQMYMSLTWETNDLRRSIMDERFSKVFAAFVETRQLPEDLGDRMALGQLYSSAFAVYENAYYARDKGVLDSREWGRYEPIMCNALRSSAAFWDADPARLMLRSGVRTSLTSTFAEHVEAVCDWPAIKAELVGRE